MFTELYMYNYIARPELYIHHAHSNLCMQNCSFAMYAHKMYTCTMQLISDMYINVHVQCTWYLICTELYMHNEHGILCIQNCTLSMHAQNCTMCK